MYALEVDRLLDAFTLGLIGAAAVAVVGAVVRWIRSLARVESRLERVEWRLERLEHAVSDDDTTRRGTYGPPVDEP